MIDETYQPIGAEISARSDDAIAELGYLLEGHLAAAKSSSDWEGSSETFSVGDRLGKFVLKEELGSGGQARVFLAIDTDLQRQTVLKIYHELEGGHDRVYAEARALSRVKSPFLVTCYEVYRHQGVPIVAQEYVNGEPLTERAASGLRTDQVVHISAGIAEAVGAIHAAGFTHRDLKPSNVIIDGAGNPRVIDFGLAMPTAVVAAGDYSGTAAYMAPERANDELERIDHRADIFGIGAILYELLTGSAPFAADSKAESLSKARAGDVRDIRGDDVGTECLRELCMHCLQQNPIDRPASAVDLVSQLRRPHQSRRKWGPAVALVAGLLLVAAIAGGILTGPAAETRENGSLPTGETPVVEWSRILAAYESGARSPEVLSKRLRQDFSLQATFPGLNEQRDGVALAREGQNFELTITAGEACSVVVYGVSFEAGSADPEVLEILYPLAGDAVFPVSEKFPLQVPLTATPQTARADFYYVVAERSIVGGPGVAAPHLRGSTRAASRSELLIPYIVGESVEPEDSTAR